ncbi:MAG: glycosyltransferase family 39 protein [bacterium]|nr:glycosyltransferase family 39 protein [bacterium]
MDIINSKKIVFFTFFSLLLFQLAFSFLYPTHGEGKGWLSLTELVSHQKSPLNGSEASLINKFSPILGGYQVNADGGQYVLLANKFPEYYWQGSNIFLPRPLYSFLISAVAFLPRLFSDSLAIVFASAIFLNFILAFGSVLLFYILFKRLISPRVAFLASLLLIFSPFFHVWLVQPLPEMLGIFMVAASLYFLASYIQSPSHLKLAVFSLIVGLFMLGKMLFAIPFFILALAVYFKRYKEGILFLIIHLIPLGLWYLTVTMVFKIGYRVTEVADFSVGSWLLNIFRWPWQQTAGIFLNILPQFISSVVYGFLLLPLVFAFLGFKNFILKNKNFICFSFIFSFLALFFIMNFYTPRHAFLLFPVIYPLAVLGIDRVADYLKRYKAWYAKAFLVAVFIFLIIISNINIFKIFPYDSSINSKYFQSFFFQW